MRYRAGWGVMEPQPLAVLKAQNFRRLLFHWPPEPPYPQTVNLEGCLQSFRRGVGCVQGLGTGMGWSRPLVWGFSAEGLGLSGCPPKSSCPEANPTVLPHINRHPEAGRSFRRNYTVPDPQSLRASPLLGFQIRTPKRNHYGAHGQTPKPQTL